MTMTDEVQRGALLQAAHDISGVRLRLRPLLRHKVIDANVRDALASLDIAEVGLLSAVDTLERLDRLWANQEGE
jgi:hypothetical protein